MASVFILNLLLYLVINAFTPGPGNILVLNTSMNYGWRRGQRLFYGVFCGYLTVQSLCALLVFTLAQLLPTFLPYLKYLGAVYILWLAWHIMASKPSEGDGEGAASFRKGYFLQLCNIKIYMFGITTQIGYISDLGDGLAVRFLGAMLIAASGILASLSWIFLGMAIQKVYLRYYRPINIVLGLILLECVISMLRM